MIETSQILISFIVPVYNVELYLEKCVNSLLRQHLSLAEFEIILIDDGSTDGSGPLCDGLAEANQSITVIHQGNKGLSEARNVGIRASKGRYIQFVDSDDYIEDGVILGLLEEMTKKNLDILRFQVRQVFENNTQSLPLFAFSSLETQTVVTGTQYLQDYMGYACYACQFLIRTSFLLENSLWFKPGIIFEDTEWTPRVLSLANRVSSINILVYDYLVRRGSITRGSVEKRTNGQLLLVKEMKEQLSSSKEKQWHQGMIAHLAVSIITSASTDLYSQRGEILDKLKELDIVPLVAYHMNTKARLKIFLINYLSPPIACTLIHLFNS